MAAVVTIVTFAGIPINAVYAHCVILARVAGTFVDILRAVLTRETGQT